MGSSTYRCRCNHHQNPLEADREDPADLEQRHAGRRAFTYTVLNPDDTECLGWVYVFPTNATFLSKFTEEWKLKRTVFVTNEQFKQQVDLMDRTDLNLKLELRESGKPGRYFIYG